MNTCQGFGGHVFLDVPGVRTTCACGQVYAGTFKAPNPCPRCQQSPCVGPECTAEVQAARDWPGAWAKYGRRVRAWRTGEGLDEKWERFSAPAPRLVALWETA